MHFIFFCHSSLSKVIPTCKASQGTTHLVLRALEKIWGYTHTHKIQFRSPIRASQMVLMVKNLPAKARGIRDTGSIPRSGRYPGGEYGNPLQYSCLENPMDRGAWWAPVHGVTKSQTQLKQLSLIYIKVHLKIVQLAH